MSLLANGLKRRRLHIDEVMKIKGLAQERRGQARKREVADHLHFTVEAEDVPAERGETIEEYLAALAMYMLAMAVAGAQPRAPLPAESETRETKPCDYVLVPWVYVHQYHLRAADLAASLPKAVALSKVKQLDEEERGEWVFRLRHGSKTLGQIIKEVAEERKQFWKPQSGPSESGTSSATLGDAQLRRHSSGSA